MNKIKRGECFFCEKNKRLYLKDMGIGIYGFGGEDYSFCEKCLREITAFEFWEKLFDKQITLDLKNRKIKSEN